MSAAIHQEVDFKATPERVYQALTDAKQFSAFSGLPAEIHNEAGGAFKCFGGQIKGRMTELSPGKRSSRRGMSLCGPRALNPWLELN